MDHRPVSLSWLAAGVAVLGTLLLGACNYGLSGGGGFPSSIKTICIQPFDNQTDHTELTGELFTALVQKVPGALGLRPGDCKRGADAEIRGKIMSYSYTPANYSANMNTTGTPQQATPQGNELDVTLSVQIIDRKRNVLLYESSALQGQGTYQSTDEATGRKAAVDNLVQKIIDGAQSQW